MLSYSSLQLRVLAVVSIAAGAVSAQTSAPVTNQLTDAERVQLSVFEVTTSKDIG
jgi:hypothetical protein